MRTLELNKQDVWVVDYEGEVDVKDENGYFTGEIETQYSTPIKHRMSLTTANGKVLEESFGLSSDVEVIVVTKIKLSKQSLIFLSEPTSNYDVTYDYKVTKIIPSINHNQYGLKGRI